MSRRKIAILSILLITAIVAFITKSALVKQPDIEAQEILIGSIVALTGPTSEVARDYAGGVRDRLFEINEQNGGIGGKKLLLVEEDSGYRVGKAIKTYKAMTREYNIVALMSWGTGETEALAPLIERDKLPCISGSFAESLTGAKNSPYVFIGGPSYKDQLDTVFDYIRSKNPGAKGLIPIAFIHSDTAFGRSAFYPGGAQRAQAKGMEVVDQVIIPLDESDAAVALEDLRNSGAKYAIINGAVNDTAVILRDAAAMELPVQMLGLGWTLDERLIDYAGPAAEGFAAAATHPVWLPEVQKRISEMKAEGRKHGHSKSHMGKAYIIGYCNMSILARAIESCPGPVDRHCIHHAFTAMKNYSLIGDLVVADYRHNKHKPYSNSWIFKIDKGRIVPETIYGESH